MWDLIESVPDHCLSFYLLSNKCSEYLGQRFQNKMEEIFQYLLLFSILQKSGEYFFYYTSNKLKPYGIKQTFIYIYMLIDKH